MNSLATNKTKAHHHSLKIMGCHFVLTAIHSQPNLAWEALKSAEKEILRIEQLISSWKSDSETARINANAGIKPVRISKELLTLILRCDKVSQLTSGAFDISGTLSRDFWNFNKGKNQWLEPLKIDSLKDLCNYRNIIVDNQNQTVYLKKKGMKIGFGAIGKGYAAQMAKEKMIEIGIKSGLVNASGDLICWGKALRKKSWEINIPDPDDHSKALLSFKLNEGSVVSSGNFENFFIHEGKRYSHIIDPRNGLPIESLKFVSVLSPNAEFADAMATAITVLGKESGLNLVNRMNGIECMIIDKDHNKYFSNNLLKQVA